MFEAQFISKFYLINIDDYPDDCEAVYTGVVWAVTRGPLWATDGVGVTTVTPLVITKPD